MRLLRDLPTRPRLAGLVAATAATGLGIAIMLAGGAPQGMAIVNAAALVIGMALLAILLRTQRDDRTRDGALVLAAAAGLLATAIWGVTIDGAVRWVRIGVVSLQPGLILLPLLIITYGRRPDRLATLGMIVAALALALQPDRAMAGTLAAGLLVVAVQHRTTHVMMALAAAVAGFTATLLQPDTLPATTFVEGVIADGFARSPAIGGALLAGLALLLLPALARGEAALLFAVVWLAIFLAAMLGNYPTPLLGHGGSGILGYLFSLAALPAHAEPASAGSGRVEPAASRNRHDVDRRSPAMAAPIR